MPTGRPATLLYNAAAGSSSLAPPDELCAALAEAGFAPQVLETTHPELLAGLLRELTGPVFLGGGDGTFRDTARHLLGRTDIQLGVLPLGTSNNIARTLGVYGDPLEVARRYRHVRVLPFDAGRVRAAWGEDVFFEACGCGVFAELLHAYDPQQGKSPLRAMKALLDILPGFQAQTLEVTVDGQPAPGPPLALLAVMNTRSTGNGLHLAPEANPGDGHLNLIRVNGAERDSLLAYGAALLRGDFHTLSSVDALPGRRITVSDQGQVFHVDHETRQSPQPGGVVDIKVWPAALRVLTPLDEG
ncbi:diacylglycerol/lipid kinase family protein [Deinococcus koreensis]|uniref:Diacylglycerol kinase n=1 Tax=Deinococcus koreensis TaxID=2054903 RepID=A0A2K3UYF7_9DEIO|nr:diacylglycerol kinase family protein [Deinococcus koreensis]PNY81570.1 diacylglycerol kinase [Deinococcus koreensis]